MEVNNTGNGLVINLYHCLFIATQQWSAVSQRA